MRDYPSDKLAFNLSVEKQIGKMLLSDSENLKNSVIDNSNFLYDNLTFYSLRNVGLKEMIQLSILSWYLPEEVRVVLQMDLSTKVNKFCFEDRIILEIILKSKAKMLIFLQETNLWHSRDFFGNILDGKTKLDRFFKLSPLRRKIKRAQRKRGYDDHGSRVPEHKRKPKFDWSLTEKMNAIYSERDSFQDTLSFLEGALY
jgi:hypothetical protein